MKLYEFINILNSLMIFNKEKHDMIICNLLDLIKKDDLTELFNYIMSIMGEKYDEIDMFDIIRGPDILLNIKLIMWIYNNWMKIIPVTFISTLIFNLILQQLGLG